MSNRTDALQDLTVYTLTELEPILGVTHRTLLTYVKNKRLKAVKIGGKWKVSKENLEKFINGIEDTAGTPEAKPQPIRLY